MRARQGAAKGGKRQSGFTLISVMLLISGLAAFAVMQFRQQMFEVEALRARNAGKQLRMLNDSIEAYLVNHAAQLRAMEDNDCLGVAGCAPSEVYCAPIGSTGNQCELDLSRLEAEGLIAPGWENEAPWGGAYRTVVTRVLKPNATGPAREWDYNLRAITVSANPWLDASGTRPMMGFLGMAVKAGGADLAMSTFDPAKVTGLARRTYSSDMSSATLVSWVGDSSMNPHLNAIGQIAARAGFEASGSNAEEGLMSVDGSRRMTNALRMGNQDITAARDAFINSAGGGRNLSSALPTWVFKYSWRVRDGETVRKPDCSAASGGWTNPTTLTNPWDPAYTPNAANASRPRDRGVARIMVTNDNLKDLKALGYDDAHPVTAAANDPYEASQRKGRAQGAYTFFAEDSASGDSWTVYFRYWQNHSFNTNGAPEKGEGIASVYCYYDNKPESACADNGSCPGTSATGPAAPDLSAPPAASSAAPEQNPAVSGSNSAPAGPPSGGAADQQMTGV